MPGKETRTSVNLQKEPLGVPFLPQDLFLLVVRFLDPTQIVLCRRVNKSWQRAFTLCDALRLALKEHYPLSYEVQRFDSLVYHSGVDPVELFDRVASRYENLRLGRPWRVEKFAMRSNPQSLYAPQHRPITPWEYRTTDVPQDHRPYRFPRPLWSFQGDYVGFFDSHKGRVQVRDLSKSQTIDVPFDMEGKFIRKLRIRERVLVIEWAEESGCHHLNEEEIVHRHFATFFDLNRDVTTSSPGNSSLMSETSIVFRNEVKMHFFGLPLNKRDRFFSMHDSKHYAVYIWQPNRSMYTGDEEAPIESLGVWDISDPSSYLPSKDPSGHKKPAHRGPQHILSLGFRELDFFDVRQRDVPSFTGIEVDDDNVYIIETADVWFGDISEDQRNRYQTDGLLWGCRSVSIPLGGCGPHIIHHFPHRMSVAEAFDRPARVRHTIDQKNPWPAKLNPKSLSLNTWIEDAHITLDEVLLHQVAARGKIAGDERLIIGENYDGELVLLWFDSKPPTLPKC